MESIEARYQVACNTIKCLKDDLDLLENQTGKLYKKYHRQFRSSAIQSFKFSMDTSWKLIKEYLEVKFAVTIAAPTPRAVFREAALVNLITKEELKKKHFGCRSQSHFTYL